MFGKLGCLAGKPGLLTQHTLFVVLVEMSKSLKIWIESLGFILAWGQRSGKARGGMFVFSSCWIFWWPVHSKRKQTTGCAYKLLFSCLETVFSFEVIWKRKPECFSAEGTTGLPTCIMWRAAEIAAEIAEIYRPKKKNEPLQWLRFDFQVFWFAGFGPLVDKTQGYFSIWIKGTKLRRSLTGACATRPCDTEPVLDGHFSLSFGDVSHFFSLSTGQYHNKLTLSHTHTAKKSCCLSIII